MKGDDLAVGIGSTESAWRDLPPCPLRFVPGLPPWEYDDIVLRCYFARCRFVGGCIVLKKPVQSASSEGKPSAYVAGLLEHFPNLADFLCQDRWEDKSYRVPGTVVIFAEDGRLKCCLNDKECEKMAFITLDDPEKLLAALDAKLADYAALDWRGVKGTKSKRG